MESGNNRLLSSRLPPEALSFDNLDAPHETYITFVGNEIRCRHTSGPVSAKNLRGQASSVFMAAKTGDARADKARTSRFCLFSGPPDEPMLRSEGRNKLA